MVGMGVLMLMCASVSVGAHARSSCLQTMLFCIMASGDFKESWGLMLLLVVLKHQLILI